MPLITSGAFVLTQPDDEFPVTLDHPVIGWHNLVTSTTIIADTAEANYPASNLANPATHLEWRAADTTKQYLTITTNYVDEIDYIAVARHNFASAEIPVSVEGFIGGVWTEIVEEHQLTDDGPVLFRFTSQSLSQIRLRMQSGVEEARAAVVYVGALLTLERKIYVGHTPMPHGRKNEIVNGMSETGNFLGRLVLGSWRESTIPLSLISPAWYREFMDEFLDAAKTTPFFFAWRPETYPLEVGFAYLMEDPMPTPQAPSNKLAFDLKVRGVA
ncbi:hypothetical protein IVB12_05520 [Bradyrhizobium sp. 179]|uniref:hypothetical protein n=1 Tax=Bradyrhizobium sp. 179 TaxID=2782648 RepID=UPI001FFBBAB9|nr:hypothetical protein [Bradyrhizobium sp. 179]MCK1541451.1 hypothetical protein [Bradyrhizobium sp. 179]